MVSRLLVVIFISIDGITLSAKSGYFLIALIAVITLIIDVSNNSVGVLLEID